MISKEIKLPHVKNRDYLKKYIPLVLLELEFDVVTTDKIRDNLNTSGSTACSVLQLMHQEGLVHVVRYEKNKKVYALGDEDDAENPASTDIKVLKASNKQLVVQRDYLVEAFFGKWEKGE